MNQIFETLEVSFEKLALEVWPHLLSGHRVKGFTC